MIELIRSIFRYFKPKKTNFDEIKKGVSGCYTSINNSRCDCGGEFKSGSQALCYSEKEKAMVDVIQCVCQSCKKEKSFSFPIQSDYGQMMAVFFQRQADLKAQGLSMFSGHTVLEGSCYDENNKYKHEDFRLKLQCYKCDNLFYYDHLESEYQPCKCTKCGAS